MVVLYVVGLVGVLIWVLDMVDTDVAVVVEPPPPPPPPGGAALPFLHLPLPPIPLLRFLRLLPFSKKQLTLTTFCIFCLP